jgi:hypothetical protein
MECFRSEICDGEICEKNNSHGWENLSHTLRLLSATLSSVNRKNKCDYQYLGLITKFKEHQSNWEKDRNN